MEKGKKIFFLKILFFPFSPQSPPVHSCIFFVVGSSSCGMWDAASAWFDEQCHVRAQDSNQRNIGPACSGARELNHSAMGPAPQVSFNLYVPSPFLSLLILYLKKLSFVV